MTALGALGAAAVAAGAGFIELGKQGAEIVEHLSQMSQKTGIGVRDLQIFEAAGKTVGLSLDEIVIGLRRFDQAISGFGKGAAAQGILRELGVSAKDNREALLQVADAFAKMPDGVKKATDAAGLFGKSGLNLIPILNKGRDGILEWENSVDAFGPKIGSQAVAANEKYRASVEKLSLQWDAFKVNVEQDVLPTLSKITDHLNGDKIRAFLKEGPLGYADAVAKLQVANAGITEENKKQSEWWADAEMAGFVPVSRSYRADPTFFKNGASIVEISIADICPVHRSVGIFRDSEDGVPARERVVKILRGFRLGELFGNKTGLFIPCLFGDEAA